MGVGGTMDGSSQWKGRGDLLITGFLSGDNIVLTDQSSLKNRFKDLFESLNYFAFILVLKCFHFLEMSSAQLQALTECDISHRNDLMLAVSSKLC